MEDVLDLYAEPYDAKRPTICFDELPYQLLSELTQALPRKAGKAQREDYQYKRLGTCNVFMHLEPLSGQRHVSVRERRTKRDFAYEMQALVNRYPDADLIRVVLDNLNTHAPAAFYETFPADEARRLTQKLEFHYTPKHGSWLNMAEIEFSVLSRQCLNRRLADMPTVQREIEAWQKKRNEAKASVDWRFSIADARHQFQRFYS